MRSYRFLTVALALALLAGTYALADPDTPHRYLRFGVDGRLVRVANPVDGRVWAVWPYRAGAQYDIAVSYRDESGLWSEPALFGADDGMTQWQPALAVDATGTLYLAYTVRETGQVFFSVRPVSASEWSTPVALRLGPGRYGSPSLRVVRDRLVVAYRVAGGGIEMIDFPLLPTVVPNAITDGPDQIPTQAPTSPEDGSGTLGRSGR